MLSAGDKVFISDNSNSLSEYSKIGFNTIKALGLVPISYTNIGTQIKQSNLDRELRDDFYSSQAMVLVFGSGPSWGDIKDQWVLSELPFAVKQGIHCLVYITINTPQDDVKALDLPITPVIVAGTEQFQDFLDSDLNKLLD